MIFVGIEEMEVDEGWFADLALEEVVSVYGVVEELIHELLFMNVFVLLDWLELFPFLVHEDYLVVLILKISLGVCLFCWADAQE